MGMRWLAVAALMFASVASGKSLYVNNSGTPACSDATPYAANDAANPWCTIGRAAWGSTTRASPVSAQAAAAGDTVYITAGTYTTTGTGVSDGVAYDPANSGSAGNPITFQASGVVRLTYSSGVGPVIGASNISGVGSSSDYIIWDGFTIYDSEAPSWTNSGDASIGNARCAYTQHCTLKNLKIYGDLAKTNTGNNYAGIWLAGDGLGSGRYYTVQGNTIQDFLNYGLFHHNAPGVMTYGTWDSVIENNTITNCGAGIHIKGYDNKNNTIRKNLVISSGDGVVIGTTSGTHYVYQNIVRNSNTGVKFQQHVSTAFSGTYWVVNNTFVNNGVDDDNALSGTGSYQDLSVDNAVVAVHIRNNIVYRGSGSSMVANSWYYWTPTDWGLVTIDTNVYYQITRYGKLQATNYDTLGAWQTVIGGCPGTGNECDSSTSNPDFVNYAAHNYKLNVGSPALTVGVDVLDLDGDSSTVDTIPAGAYITGSETIGAGAAALAAPGRPRWRPLSWWSYLLYAGALQ